MLALRELLEDVVFRRDKAGVLALEPFALLVEGCPAEPWLVLALWPVLPELDLEVAEIGGPCLAPPATPELLRPWSLRSRASTAWGSELSKLAAKVSPQD
jgi:hypothetical protein